MKFFWIVVNSFGLLLIILDCCLIFLDCCLIFLDCWLIIFWIVA